MRTITLAIVCIGLAACTEGAAATATPAEDVGGSESAASPSSKPTNPCAVKSSDLVAFETAGVADHELVQCCDPGKKSTNPCVMVGSAKNADCARDSGGHINFGALSAIAHGVNVYTESYAVVVPLQVACVHFGIPLTAATASNLVPLQFPGAGNPPSNSNAVACNPGNGPSGVGYCVPTLSDIFGASGTTVASSGWSGWDGGVDTPNWGVFGGFSGVKGWNGLTGWNNYNGWSGPLAWTLADNTNFTAW
jgi:hypothetical protein